MPRRLKDLMSKKRKRAASRYRLSTSASQSSEHDSDSDFDAPFDAREHRHLCAFAKGGASFKQQVSSSSSESNAGLEKSDEELCWCSSEDEFVSSLRRLEKSKRKAKRVEKMNARQKQQTSEKRERQKNAKGKAKAKHESKREEEYENSAGYGAAQKTTQVWNMDSIFGPCQNRKQKEKDGTEYYAETCDKATGMEDCPWLEAKKIFTCDAATDTQDFTEWGLKEVEAGVENMLGRFEREQEMSETKGGPVGDEPCRIRSSIHVAKTLQMVEVEISSGAEALLCTPKFSENQVSSRAETLGKTQEVAENQIRSGVEHLAKTLQLAGNKVSSRAEKLAEDQISSDTNDLPKMQKPAQNQISSSKYSLLNTTAADLPKPVELAQNMLQDQVRIHLGDALQRSSLAFAQDTPLASLGTQIPTEEGSSLGTKPKATFTSLPRSEKSMPTKVSSYFGGPAGYNSKGMMRTPAMARNKESRLSQKRIYACMVCYNMAKKDFEAGTNPLHVIESMIQEDTAKVNLAFCSYLQSYVSP